MADPWRILGLDADSANEKQVRSAYAKLLKVHRPDQDPEGFQRLRTSYQQALNWLQQRDIETDAWDDDEVEVPPDKAPSAVVETHNVPSQLPPSWAEGEAPLLPHQLDPQPPSQHIPPPLPPSWAEGEAPLLPHQVDPQPPSQKIPPPLPPSWAEGEAPLLPHQLNPSPPAQQPPAKKRPERDWPREWSYSIESLDRALQGGSRQFDAVAMALKALAADVVECGISPYALECILKDAFQDDLGLFGMNVPASILSWLMQGGCIAFLNDALDALEQADKPMHLVQLAQKFDDSSAYALSPVTVAIFFRVAGLAAIHNPFIAKSIGRKLRRLLDDDSHTAQFDRLHEATMRGMALRDLGPEHRSFWAQRLDHPKAACDWETGLPAQGLAAVVLLGKKWGGNPLVQSVVPADVWENAWKGRWKQLAAHRMARILHPRILMVAAFAVIGGGLLIFGAHVATQASPARKQDSAPKKGKFESDYDRTVDRFIKEYLEKEMQKKAQPGIE